MRALARRVDQGTPPDLDFALDVVRRRKCPAVSIVSNQTRMSFGLSLACHWNTRIRSANSRSASAAIAASLYPRIDGLKSARTTFCTKAELAPRLSGPDSSNRSAAGSNTATRLS